MRNELTYKRMQDAEPATGWDVLALPSALLASVSHDLRNPLAVIHGAAEALHERSAHLVGEDGRAYLRAIRSECLRMDEYAKALLSVTRLLMAGGSGLVREWVDVHGLARSAMDRLLRYRDGVRVRLEVESPLAEIHVHGVLIEQAVLNVLDNAAKFAPPATAITLRITQDAAGGTEIEVVDAGPGIAASQRERVFHMFVSEDPHSSGRLGSGLGLAISRGILRAHGGDVVAVEPAGGAGGTRIRLTLPAAGPAGERR